MVTGEGLGWKAVADAGIHALSVVEDLDVPGEGEPDAFMPCAWHGTDNIRKRLTPTKGRLPEKVRDHLFTLTRDTMATAGPKAVKDWVDEPELLVKASEMPMETAASCASSTSRC